MYGYVRHNKINSTSENTAKILTNRNAPWKMFARDYTFDLHFLKKNIFWDIRTSWLPHSDSVETGRDRQTESERENIWKYVPMILMIWIWTWHGASSAPMVDANIGKNVEKNISNSIDACFATRFPWNMSTVHVVFHFVKMQKFHRNNVIREEIKIEFTKITHRGCGSEFRKWKWKKISA